MKAKYISFIITLSLIISTLLSGCARQFDRSGYLKALLDAECLEDYTEYSEYTGRTAAELSEDRDEWMDSEINLFLAEYGSLSPSDSTRNSIKELLNVIYSNAKYSAGDDTSAETSLIVEDDAPLDGSSGTDDGAAAETTLSAGDDAAEKTMSSAVNDAAAETASDSGDDTAAEAVPDSGDEAAAETSISEDNIATGASADTQTSESEDTLSVNSENTVLLTIYPITIFRDSAEDIQKYTAQFNQNNAQFQYYSYTSRQYADEYLNGLITLIQTKVAEIKYGDPVQLTITFTKVDDGLYSISPEQLKRVIRAILPYR